MPNYNPLFSENTAGFYEKGGQVKVENNKPLSNVLVSRQLVNSNPLSTEKFVDYGPSLEALQYGFGKGITNRPLTNVQVHNGRSLQQVREMDASNYYNFIK